jgi:hypothetical protein
MSYGRMKQEEERLSNEIDALMEQAEILDREEDEAFGKDINGYNLPEELKRREGRLEKIRSIREELEREKREEQHLNEGQSPIIEDKEQRSFADHDARVMPMKRGGFDYGYNGQVCVDEEEGVILAGELTNEAFDGGHLPGLVDEVRRVREELGRGDGELTQITADSGYFSVDNIEQEGKGIELLIASGREGKEEPQGERVYSLERFDYVKEDDSWRCPGGRLLVREQKRETMGRPLLRRYICPDCEGCPLRKQCLGPGEESRSLLVKRKQLIRAEMRARLKMPEKRAIYRKRKWVAEQNIGQIKEGMGFRGVTTRGKVYARAQWLLALAVHNLLKAVRFIARLRRQEAVPVTNYKGN